MKRIIPLAAVALSLLLVVWISLTQGQANSHRGGIPLIPSTGGPNHPANKAYQNLDHVIDVRDYGAVADGSSTLSAVPAGTNNTTAIQAAIDAASAAGGGIVYFPDGVFEHTSTLTVADNVTLWGNGPRSSWLRYTGTGTGVTTDATPVYVYFDGLQICSSTLAQAASHAQYNVNIQGTGSEIHFRNCHITHNSKAGLLLAGTGGGLNVISVTDCYFSGASDVETGYGAIYSTGPGANAIHVHNTQIASNSGWGIKHTGNVARQWSITNSIIQGNTTGEISFDCVWGLNVTGNYFEETVATAPLIFLNGYGGSANQGVLIAGNHFNSRDDYYSIYVADVNGLTIIGNDFATTSSYQIYCPDRTLTNYKIAGNEDRGSAGLLFDGASTFDGDYISDTIVVEDDAVSLRGGLSLGSEIVGNGGFASTTTGWTAVQCTIASAAGGQSGNCLQITKTDVAAAWAAQTIKLIVGKEYRLTGWVKSGTSGDEPFQLYTADAAGVIDGTTSAAWVQYSDTFVATSASTEVRCRKSSVTDGTMLFDTVSLTEVAYVDIYNGPNKVRLAGQFLPADANSFCIYTKQVDLTNANIKALAAGVELVAAPGAGRWLELVSASLWLDYGSEVLVEPSSPDDLAIEYDTGTGPAASASIVASGFITAAADTGAFTIPVSLAGVASASIVNKNLALINTGTDYTGNASNNTVILVIVNYRIHDSLGL